jgi:hypothetical protein
MKVFNDNRRLYFFAPLLLVFIYLLAGFYPFHLQRPPGDGQVNGAIALPDQTIQFRAPGIAYTDSAPSWLANAISTSRFEVSLEVRSADQAQYGPARIFTVSSDRSHRNLSVGGPT